MGSSKSKSSGSSKRIQEIQKIPNKEPAAYVGPPNPVFLTVNQNPPVPTQSNKNPYNVSVGQNRNGITTSQVTVNQKPSPPTLPNVHSYHGSVIQERNGTRTNQSTGNEKLSKRPPGQEPSGGFAIKPQSRGDIYAQGSSLSSLTIGRVQANSLKGSGGATSIRKGEPCGIGTSSVMQYNSNSGRVTENRNVITMNQVTVNRKSPLQTQAKVNSCQTTGMVSQERIKKPPVPMQSNVNSYHGTVNQNRNGAQMGQVTEIKKGGDNNGKRPNRNDERLNGGRRERNQERAPNRGNRGGRRNFRGKHSQGQIPNNRGDNEENQGSGVRGGVNLGRGRRGGRQNNRGNRGRPNQQRPNNPNGEVNPESIQGIRPLLGPNAVPMAYPGNPYNPGQEVNPAQWYGGYQHQGNPNFPGGNPNPYWNSGVANIRPYQRNPNSSENIFMDGQRQGFKNNRGRGNYQSRVIYHGGNHGRGHHLNNRRDELGAYRDSSPGPIEKGLDTETILNFESAKIKGENKQQYPTDDAELRRRKREERFRAGGTVFTAKQAQKNNGRRRKKVVEESKPQPELKLSDLYKLAVTTSSRSPPVSREPSDPDKSNENKEGSESEEEKSENDENSGSEESDENSDSEEVEENSDSEQGEGNSDSEQGEGNSDSEQGEGNSDSEQGEGNSGSEEEEGNSDSEEEVENTDSEEKTELKSESLPKAATVRDLITFD